MSRVLRELNSFQSNLNEIGNFTNFGLLQIQCNRIKDASFDDLRVAVTRIKPLSASNEDLFSSWLNTKDDVISGKWKTGYKVEEHGIDDMLRLKLGDGSPLVWFLLHDGNEAPTQEQMLSINRIAERKLLTFIVCEDRNIFYPLKVPFTGNLNTITWNNLQNFNITSLLDIFLNRDVYEKFLDYQLGQRIEPLYTIAEVSLKKENRAASLRKILQTQSGTLLKQEESKINFSEINSTLRYKIQSETSELEKSLKLKYDLLNKPNTGEFSILVNEKAKDLEDFDRAENLERSEKITIKPSKAFEQNFEGHIEKRLQEEFDKDSRLIRDQVSKLQASILQSMQQHGVSVSSNAFEIPPLPDSKRTIQSYAQIVKTYTGELNKPGMTEYFIAVRDYTTLISTVAGLLMPLILIFSNIDEKWFPGSKHISTIIRVVTAVISISMISYGFYSLRKKIPLKRKELFDKELSRARETISLEGKRMLNDASKDWQSVLANYFKEISVRWSVEIENTFKQVSKSKQQIVNEEKQQLSKFGTALDQFQRKLTNCGKNIDSSLQNLNNLKKEVADIVYKGLKEIKQIK